jgi:hypothetical protein
MHSILSFWSCFIFDSLNNSYQKDQSQQANHWPKRSRRAVEPTMPS